MRMAMVINNWGWLVRCRDSGLSCTALFSFSRQVSYYSQPHQCCDIRFSSLPEQTDISYEVYSYRGL